MPRKTKDRLIHRCSACGDWLWDDRPCLVCSIVLQEQALRDWRAARCLPE